MHEDFGVSMGSRFAQPDENNPNGYYEDLDFKEINESVIRGIITFPEWQIRVKKTIGQRGSEWGLKDPRLSYLLGFYLSVIKDVVILRCKRDAKATVSSVIRAYSWSDANARRFVENRETLLNGLLSKVKHVVIDTNTTVTKESLSHAYKSANQNQNNLERRRQLQVS